MILQIEADLSEITRWN